MVIIVAEKIEKMAADSKIVEQELAAQASENGMRLIADRNGAIQFINML